MQRIINKIDYQLYEELFLNFNLDKVHELWQVVISNSFFLKEAIKIIKDGPNQRFQAPIICLMILKYYYMVPYDIYIKLVQLILTNPNIADSILIRPDYHIDYLSLILANNEIKLDEFERRHILEKSCINYGLLDKRTFIKYHQISKISSPIVIHFNFGNFCIEVTHYENEIFLHGLAISCENGGYFKSVYDYRYAIIKNQNFTESEKSKVLTQLLNDELEFKSYLNYRIYILYSIFIKHNEMSFDDLKTLPLEEIASKIPNGKQLVKELAIIRQITKEHLNLGSNLVRNKK